MTARAALHTLLAEDAVLREIGVEHVYATSELDTPSEEMFIVIVWQEDGLRAFGQKAPNRVYLWVHDKAQDYGRIDKALKRLKDLLGGTFHRPGADGWTLTLAEWNRNGPDVTDDVYRTVAKWGDFTVVSRYDTTES